ncbi:hypothetical protein BD289DRAFT_456225 [Coniella lustricola]|uniref:Uncharacterized protein n=1 Tax=Coniella lustricola TaxID=2025994 RepID=A0A2T2ZWM1_9PEZI|nr:hypothetical protein BD289DRAFT_456225 [Coniella lustricola]
MPQSAAAAAAMDSTAAPTDDSLHAPPPPSSSLPSPPSPPHETGMGDPAAAASAHAPASCPFPAEPQRYSHQPAQSVQSQHNQTADDSAHAHTQAQTHPQSPASPSENSRNLPLDQGAHEPHPQPHIDPAQPGTGAPAAEPAAVLPSQPLPQPQPPLLQRLHSEHDLLANPRHELPLIPEDQPIDSPHPSDSDIASRPPPDPSSSILLSGALSARASATSTPDTTTSSTIRPPVLRPIPHSRPSRSSSQSPPTSPVSPAEAPASPAIIRTASSNSVLRHPAPDINARSGSYTSNIAALEATAERLSMTSSIEDAIRDAHNQLKRSDSRRSSILAAAASIRTDFHNASHNDAAAAAQILSQSSIVGLNNAARTGGYSPAGYIMSPTQSLTGRLRSGSKGSGPLSRANSTRSKPETIEGEAFPNLSTGSFMSRDGPGKGSTRSVRSARSVHSVHSTYSVQSNRSGPLSLAEIAEMEPPATLTPAVMDEADRLVAGKTSYEDDSIASIAARAHQHVDPDATDLQVVEETTQQTDERHESAPLVDEMATSPYWNDHVDVNLRIRNPTEPQSARGHDEYESDQHNNSYATPDTADEENVFADFDGMHCDPDSVAEHFPVRREKEAAPRRQPGVVQPRRTPAARPQSYFDPETNQQMLYYPARVPAMLNLPPKLGKGMKAAQAAKAARRSQLLSQMPKPARESRAWLPDPLETEGQPRDLLGVDLTPSSLNLLGDDVTPSSAHSSSRGLGPEHALAALMGPNGQVSHENSPMDPQDMQPLRRPAKLGGGGHSDARQSRMNLSDLPPQLRASVFFDLPSESAPKLEVKNGSAMDTLDSILDAAASAPVNAFTDHAFAGHLGSEVYGHERKKSRKSQLILAEAKEEVQKKRLSKAPATTLAVPDNEKRKSVWSLLPGRKSRSSVNLLNAQEDDARSRLSASAHDDNDSASDVDERSALAPDDDERGFGSGSEDAEALYSGQPTTLLAELQMRKQQHKNRTRNPLHQGNGLHSTLLELDTVAQLEAKQRKSKQVNLAWAADKSDLGSEAEDDEDVPLGLLAAKKQLGPEATERDLAMAVQEITRPLGLMEKREIDDNEPLSRRRDRLQGKPVPVSMYLQPGGTASRLSMMPGNDHGRLSPYRLANGGSGTNTPQGEVEEEVEGETLGERMRRLRGENEENPLPRARRVSMAFSEELLGEWGIDEQAEKKKKKQEEEAAKAKTEAEAAATAAAAAAAAAAASPVVEEEETLGQRRRRLQAEREAREKEMGIRAVPAENDVKDDDAAKSRLSRRLSMASVLGANPIEGPQGRVDPREAARTRKAEEGSRSQREQDAKMRAFRNQMPLDMSDPTGGVVKPGGFQSGRFNDSNGGYGVPAVNNNSRAHLRASMSMSQLGGAGGAVGGNNVNPYSHNRRVMSSSGGAGGLNLIGAAGNYSIPYDPHQQQRQYHHADGLNPVFAKTNTFGNGYSGGFMQQPQFQTASPFVSGGLLSQQDAYGAVAGGAYPTNQTAYGAGVGFGGPAMNGGGGMGGYYQQTGAGGGAGGGHMSMQQMQTMQQMQQMQMQMQMFGGQPTERVERWRQGIR